MSDENRSVAIPSELEKMLLDFTVNVLTNNPPNLVDHAVTYFTRLKETRSRDSSSSTASTQGTSDIKVRNTVSDKIACNLGTRRGRRISVCGEMYDPERDNDNTEIESYEKTLEQRKKIREHIRGVFLFKVLEENDMEAVIDAMMPRPVKAGEVIIRQGDDGDYCYIIETGTYDVHISQNGKEEEYIKTYQDLGCFGELALLYNVPRAATITATCDGFLWAISRCSFRKLVVRRAHDKRQNYINLLSSVPELKPLSNYEKMVVCDALTPVSFQPNQVIFRQGDEADGMYFIVEGKVAITDEKEDGKSNQIVELSKGEYFGELALVKKKPRAATATASTIVRLAFLDLLAFERLLGPCMAILQRHIDTYEEI